MSERDGPLGEGTLRLEDSAATRQLGRRLAPLLLREGACRLLLLSGDLGAGKTCLVQGLARAIGIEEPITSPTFALAQHYGGRLGGQPTRLVHLDLYRLEGGAAADELFAQEEEEAAAAAAVLAVEWPERLGIDPGPAWRIQLEAHGADGTGRLARIQPPETCGEGGSRSAP
jgi:tRNA threonylcarbamoyladenosine biosynthesis protein TsaE